MMNSKAILKTVAALFATGLMTNSNANSVGFDQNNYTAGTEVLVTLIYDFTDFAMFGGGVDIEYDSNALQFVSFVQAPLPPDTDAGASPVGSLTSPGLYSNVGIGSFKFFLGTNSAGPIGSFTFDVLGINDPGATSCGFALCILPSGINPFVSLAGNIVDDELIGNGISGANIVQPVPLPAAAWLMLGGLAGLVGLGRKSL